MLTPPRIISERGYVLLVEALVAFSLFLVAAIGFYSMLAGVHRAETKARQTRAATAYARELLEQNRGAGYSALKIGKTSGHYSLKANRGKVATQMEMDYLVQVTDGPISGVKSVKVRVVWHDGQVSLEGYVGE
mgnify:CR=1 FL=1